MRYNKLDEKYCVQNATLPIHSIQFIVIDFSFHLELWIIKNMLIL